MNPPDETTLRAPAFRRNVKLEQLLEQLNNALRPAETELLAQIDGQEATHPIVFVMGPLRSGTTLFMQWLATTGIVAYPTNLISRFYAAPVVGAKIQLLLTDPRYNFRNEILDFCAPPDFTSENGKTRGALAPNEFWYFWRRFLPFGELDWLSDDALFERVDRVTLTRELNALAQVFERPFALKGMILNYNIRFLNAIFAKALFVQIRRDPVANVESVLDARKRQFGDASTWYSFKIPEYPVLRSQDALHQAAGQVSFINKAVAAGMRQLAESRRLTVHYEEFCADPSRVFRQLLAKLTLPERPYTGPAGFAPTRASTTERRREVVSALDRFAPEAGAGA